MRPDLNEACVVCSPGHVCLHASPCSTFRTVVTAAVILCRSVFFICKVGCDSLIDNAKLRPESGFRKFIGLNFSAVLSAHKG